MTDNSDRIAVLRNHLPSVFAQVSLRCLMNRAYGFRLSPKGMADMRRLRRMFFPTEPIPETEPELASVIIHAPYAWVDIQFGVKPFDMLSDELIVQLWIMLTVDSHEWYDFFPNITEGMKHE